MIASNLRRGLVAALAGGLALGLTGSVWAGRHTPNRPVAHTAQVSNDELGDARATTTHDGPMVRRRTAIAIHPLAGADRDLLRRQLEDTANIEHLAPLTDATFAVFSPNLLHYLVPEMTVVLPEGATSADAEYIMNDHTFSGLGFYVVEPVLVHDLAFSVVPVGVTPADVGTLIQREGVLTDVLGRYTTDVKPAGVVFEYFGAILSDSEVLSVQQAIARAAGVGVTGVTVGPVLGGPGVAVANEPAIPTEHAGHSE
jgi:hypothetical protein